MKLVAHYVALSMGSFDLRDADCTDRLKRERAYGSIRWFPNHGYRSFDMDGNVVIDQADMLVEVVRRHADAVGEESAWRWYPHPDSVVQQRMGGLG